MNEKKIITPRERTLISDADLKQRNIKFFYWLFLSLLLIGTITTFLPFFWSITSALKSSSEIFAYPPKLFPGPSMNPFKWNWGNYIEAWERVKFPKYFLNTIILAIGVWFFNIFPAALSAYALSKLKIPFVKIISLLFFATLMVPFQAVLIPLYITVTKLPLIGINLLNDFKLFENGPVLIPGGYLAIMLPAGVNAFNIFVLKSFFDEIPKDLIEAARIDGAGEMRIFLLVALPLTQSALAVLTIFSFMGTWNDFLWPYLVIRDPSKYTVMIKMFFFNKQGDISWNLMMSALVLASLPPIIIFSIFQKKIMQGINLSGMKI